jgi:NADH-quinone oxidoreductase subunit M
MNLLGAMILLPWLGAVAVLVSPRERGAPGRPLALAVMLLEAALSLRLLSADYGEPGYRFVERHVVSEALGLSWAVGVDGLSLWPIIGVSLVMPALAWAPFDSAGERERLVAGLWLQGAVVGALCAFDLALFYGFWEMSLLPLLLLARGGGQAGAETDAGARRATLGLLAFALVSSLCLLSAIGLLAAEYRAAADRFSFNLGELRQLLLPATTQTGIFLLFVIGLGARLPLWPLHGSWGGAGAALPAGARAMAVVSGALLGGHGLLRHAMSLCPAGSHRVGASLAAIAVLGLFYAALAAGGARSRRRALSLLSLAPASLFVVGVYSITGAGLAGAVMVLLAGALSLSLWSAVGEESGGGFLPLLALSPLPGSAGFAGAVMVLSAAMGAEHLGRNGPALVGGAALGAALLWAAVLRVVVGPTPDAARDGAGTLALRGRLLLSLPAVAVLVLLGLSSDTALSRIAPAADHFARVYTAKIKASDAHPEGRGLLERVVPDADGGAP